METAAESVLFRQDGRVGRITLNRPKALHALDLVMIGEIEVALALWRDDPAIHLVVIDAVGERAFCAGGDVRWVRDAVLAGRQGAAEAFFVREYALNRTIARYEKPYVALIDGICMGGGIGLSAHGTVRVTSEHAAFAMPETQLGLFPDVGASYVLPRLRGAFGMYLGLTGARIGGADACWLGLATHFVSRDKLPALTAALAREGIAALSDFAETRPTPTLPAIEAEVNAIFGQPSLAHITRSLEGVDAPWAQAASAALRSASPSALHWTFDLLRAGAQRTFEECQRAETLLTRRACSHPDFVEGVRANVVDKDRKAVWQPLAT